MYPPATFAVGPDRAGQPITLSPMTRDAAAALGAATATFGPWLQYGLSPAAMTRAFVSTDAEEKMHPSETAARYAVSCGSELAGGMVIRDPWLVGPYLQTLAVLPVYQGSGVGGQLLTWFERRARQTKQRNIWLCVSGFNVSAQRFYMAHGWQRVADLDGLIRDDVTEWLMRKRLT
jgi:diamine N-acetyltransferase